MSGRIFKRRSPHRKKCRPHVDDLIRDQDWDAILKAIEATSARFPSSSTKMTFSRQCSSSALALAVTQQPPADVVSSLLQINPAAASRRDRCGRLPIHVACSTGASVDVVQLLLKSSSLADGNPSGEINQNAALCTDANNRVPLHYAAEYAVGSYGDTLDAVTMLCAACPEAVSVQDAWGETPGDVVANMADTAFLDGDLEMVEAARAVGWVLRQTSMMLWRRNSRIGRRRMALLVVNAKEEPLCTDSSNKDIGPKQEEATTADRDKSPVSLPQNKQCPLPKRRLFWNKRRVYSV